MNHSFILADHPIFICGHPDAGINLITALLDDHPELLVYPEDTMFFRRYLPAIEKKSLAEQLRLADELLIHIFTWNRTSPPSNQVGYMDRDYSDISFEAIRDALHRRVSNLYRHPGDILSASVLAYGEVKEHLNSSVKGWIEKTPFNEAYASLIFTVWPQAKCIHIVRDPRDNFASYKKKHPDWTAEIFSSSWAKSTRLAFKNQALFGEKQYLLIRYEDLVQESGAVIRKICNYLEIQESPTMDQSNIKNLASGGYSVISKQLSASEPQTLDRWRDHLSLFDTAMIENLLGSLMRKLDYQLDNIPLSMFPLRDRTRLLQAKAKGSIKSHLEKA